MLYKRRRFNQLTALFMSICLIVGLAPGLPAALASGDRVVVQLTDVSGHWAEDVVGMWVGKGLIAGYGDRTFRPDTEVNRAEFMALVNRAFGFAATLEPGFADITTGAWYYDDVTKALAAGYMFNPDEVTADPGRWVTREEAASAIAILMKLPIYAENAIGHLADSFNISEGHRQAVNSVVAEKYMVGNGDGTFSPKRTITRAETVAILSRMTGEIYNRSGVYDDSVVYQGNVTINTPDVTLANAIVEGNLFLTSGIGEGTVILKNVTVKGKTLVAGGGSNSIILEDCDLNEVQVIREDGKVRISARGTTTIQVVVVETDAIVDGTMLSEDGGILTLYVVAGVEIELSGDFGSVRVDAPGALLSLLEGSIADLIIEGTASGTAVHLAADTYVASMEIGAPVTVSGQGDIVYALIAENAREGTSFEKPPGEDDGSLPEDPVDNESETPVSPPPIGGGGGVTPPPTPTAISLAAVGGVTVPTTGATPVSVITETAQYTGTVTWSPAHATFAAGTVYTATITLTAKSGYTLSGVTANFFTVAGATSSTNAANSGLVTAVFPATAPLPQTYTLTLTGDNISSVPAPGTLPENTSVTVTVAPDTGKQVAIFTVNGTDRKLQLTANQYAFAITSDTTVAVAYEDIPAGGDEVPPALTADTVGNYVRTNLDVLFTDVVAWRTAVTAVKVGGATLELGTQYELLEGMLRLKSNAIPAMHLPGTFPVTVEATGYQTAFVTQPVISVYSGSGTAADPFLIGNVADLDNVRHYVAVPGLHFRQTADIDLSGHNWQPIGQYLPGQDQGAFMGFYDGANYTIENLAITDSSDVHRQGAGLFAYTKNATLIRVRLTGVDINMPNTGSVGGLVGVARNTDIANCHIFDSTRVKAHMTVGGLIGWAYQGTVTTSSADVTVIGETFANGHAIEIGGFVGNSNGANITSSSAHGNVWGIGDVGGFAGRMDYGHITGCYATGNVTGYGTSARDTGGFVGFNWYALADMCYSLGNVTGRTDVGGFIGRNSGSITNSYARGSVTATGSNSGGFAGTIQKNNPSLLGGDASLIEGCYSESVLSSSGAREGAFLGYKDETLNSGSLSLARNYFNLSKTAQGDGNAAGLTDEDMKKQISFADWDFVNVWAIQEGMAAPYLRWQVLSDEARLNSLSVVGHSLAPAFDANTTSYTVDVDSVVDAVDLIVAPVHANASIAINGTLTGIGTPRSVALGSTGSTTSIVVRVTAENNVAFIEYTVSVYRATEVASFTLTYSAGPNGSLSGSTSQSVISGGSGTAVTAVADGGYEFVGWSDGVQDNPRTDTNVTAHVSATANFDPVGTPPAWTDTYPMVYSFTDQGFRIGVAMDTIGVAYYLVVANDSAAPTAQQVRSMADYGGVTVLRSGAVYNSHPDQPAASPSLVGLSPDTEYDVYVVAATVAGALQVSPVKLDARTLPLQAPQFFTLVIGDGVYPRVDNVGSNQLDIKAGFNNKTGRVYYVVVSADSTPPSAQQVVDGLDYGNVTLAAHGAFAVTSTGTVFTETVFGLDPLTEYDIFLVAADNSDPMNMNPTVKKLSALTVPDESPLFHEGSPFTYQPREYGFRVAAGLDRPGWIYMIVVTAGADAPNSEEVKQGLGYRGVQVLAHGSLEAPDPTSVYDLPDVRSLEHSTTYDIYVVAEDSSKTHIQAMPSKLQETTTDYATAEANMRPGYPAVPVVSTTSATATVSTDRKSRLYYMVVPAAFSLDKDAVVAGKRLHDERHVQVAAGMVETEAFVEISIPLVGLNPGTQYAFLAVGANWYNGDYSSGVASPTLFTTTGSAPPDATLGITSWSENGFNVSFSMSSEAAKAYYMVVPDGSQAPSYSQLMAGSPYAGVTPLQAGSVSFGAGGGTSASITGLTAASHYNVYVGFEAESDVNRHTITPIRLDASTAGTQPPSFSQGLSVRQVRDTSAVLEVGISKTGSIYYMLVAQGASAPSAAQVKAGTGYASVSVVKAGTIAATADVLYSETIYGLSPATNYDLYVVAEADGLLQAAPVMRQIQTLSAYIPVFSGNMPIPLSIGSEGLVVEFALYQTGTVYYLVLPGGATAPTAAQVRQPDTYGGTKLSSSHVPDVPAAMRTSVEISGLSPATAYDIYFVAEGTSGGLSAAPLKRQYTTLSMLAFSTGPALTDMKYHRFTVEGQLNRRSDVHFILIPVGAAAPTPAEVKAGANYGSVTVLRSGSLQNVLFFSRIISELSANTGYDLYLVLEETGTLSGTRKESLTTPVMPTIAFALFPPTPVAYVGTSFIGIDIRVALNRPGTAYVASFSEGETPTQQQVIDSALSGVNGAVMNIVLPDVEYAMIKDWNHTARRLWIVVTDGEQQGNYIQPSPQEITVLTR